MDCKLRKAKLDINFFINCKQETVIPNFLKFRLANKDLQILLPILRVNRMSYKQKLATRDHVWELFKMNLIASLMIYNLTWTVLILPTCLLFFLVAMIIFFFSFFLFVQSQFFSRTFTIHRTAGEGRGGISLTPLCHFHLLHRHLDISWAITDYSAHS